MPHHHMSFTVANDASVFEQRERVTIAQRQPKIVDNQQSDAAMTPAVVGYLIEHAQLMMDVQCAGRFVEQNDLRLSNESLSQHNQLPLPTAKTIEGAIGERGNAAFRHSLFRLRRPAQC